MKHFIVNKYTYKNILFTYFFQFLKSCFYHDLKINCIFQSLLISKIYIFTKYEIY